jgi:hypothetical protein
MSIKKITITFGTTSKSKLETPMFNIIEKFLKSFFRLAGKLPSRDLAEFLRSLILALAILCAFYLGTR